VSSFTPEEFRAPPPAVAPALRRPSRSSSRLNVARGTSALSYRSESSMLIVLDEDSPLARRRRRRDDELRSDIGETAEAAEPDEFDANGISHRAIAALLGFLPQGLWGSAEEVARLCTGVVARLASRAEKCQALEEGVLWHAIAALLPPAVEVTGAVQSLARRIVDRATVVNSFGAHTGLRHAIVGPPKSGKSVFLRTLTTETLARFFASGQYRKTLVLYFDLVALRDVREDPIALYREIVRITFRHIAAQKVVLAPYVQALTRYFLRIPTQQQFVALPNAFAQQDEFRPAVSILSILANQLYQALNSDRPLDAWLALVVTFPRSAALAFGFGSVHFVVDHLDAIDVDVVPHPPFDMDREASPLIEHFKTMLNSDSFAVSCANEEIFLGLLAPSRDNFVDLREGTQIVSVVGIDNGHQDRYAYRLTFEDGGSLFLKMDSCGGALGYLHLWDEIITLSNRLRSEEKKDDTSRVSREFRLLLNEKIQGLLALILLRQNVDGSEGQSEQRLLSQFEIVDTNAETGLRPEFA
jgi:hypothetical protein